MILVITLLTFRLIRSSFPHRDLFPRPEANLTDAIPNQITEPWPFDVGQLTLIACRCIRTGDRDSGRVEQLRVRPHERSPRLPRHRPLPMVAGVASHHDVVATVAAASRNRLAMIDRCGVRTDDRRQHARQCRLASTIGTPATLQLIQPQQPRSRAGLHRYVIILASIRMIQFPSAQPMPAPRAARKNPAQVCHTTGGAFMVKSFPSAAGSPRRSQ